MPLFKVFKKRTIHWDGRKETGSEYGWGDFTSTAWDEVGTVEAEDEMKARKFARRIFKSKGWVCYFSRTGINCLLEEIKTEGVCAPFTTKGVT